MACICFISYEITPTTAGGCGVLLSNAAQILLPQGHSLIFLLDMPYHTFLQFRDIDRLSWPNPENCRAYHVETLAKDIPHPEKTFPNIFLWRAYRFHWAACKIATREEPDIIEFFDYGGVAHYALAAKLAGQCYQNSEIAIRLHSSLEILDVHEATKFHDYERYQLFALEHHTLQLAETILYPSENFLIQAYQPNYPEGWLGQTILSPPPLVRIPQWESNIPQAKNVILFFGRLFGVKGVDLFVEAGVALFAQQVYPPATRLVLAGYDSGQPPDNSSSYQEYLLKKIPESYRSNFEFTGQLSWQELEALLPQVRYAVFPNYFESFGYAIHELYEARIPVILNDLPAFRDNFQDGQNSLLFDGSVAHLMTKMKRLYQDDDLRQKITHPYSVVSDTLGNYYQTPLSASWMSQKTAIEPLTGIICILADEVDLLEPTLQSLAQIDNFYPLIFTPAQATPDQPTINFLGQLYNVTSRDSTSLLLHQLKTKQLLLLIKAGDIVSSDYLELAQKTLSHHPELSFVSCWKRTKEQGNFHLDTFPLDATTELLPMRPTHQPSRAVLRTMPDQLVVDLFDPRLEGLGEIGYIWHLEDTLGPGILIPEAFIELNSEPEAKLNPNLISYLLLQDRSLSRKARLARHLISYFTNRTLSHSRDVFETIGEAEKLAVELETMKATKGWQLLEKYWQLRDNIKMTLSKYFSVTK